MKRYLFRWNKFAGFSLIVIGVLWSEYMILGAIEGFARAMRLTNVPSGGDIIILWTFLATIGCVILAIEEEEVSLLEDISKIIPWEYF